MTNKKLKEYIINCCENHIAIPKPESGHVFIEKIGTTKIVETEKEGFQYSENRKYVPFETLFLCYKELLVSGELKTEWFKKTFPNEYKGRPCNFTTIGGVFELLNIATYKSRGVYIKK